MADLLLKQRVLSKLVAPNTLVDIHFTSTFTALYEYEEVVKQWNKRDMEGSIYVVELEQEPYFEIYLTNKKNNEDYREQINQDLKLHSVDEKMFAYRS